MQRLRDYVEQYTVNPENAGGPMWDAKDGPFTRSIKDPEGEPFMRRVDDESRLCFSLFVDWFNPHHGKHHSPNSVGAIYLVCLNLPAHLRRKREYTLHLANIPGPKEPSMEQINHVLRPVVDQLLELWSPGVWLSRTRSYRYGRICRGIVINLSGDILGIQKIGGLASHNSPSFCFLCQSPRSHLHDLNLESWGEAWSYQEHKNIILSWKNAETQDERHRIYRDYGFRYSELSRLPYLDIIRATALDSMHIMSLGLQKDYGENILGMKGQAPGNSSESGSSDSDTSDSELSDEEDEISLGGGSGTRAAMDKIRKDLTAPNSTMTVQKLALKLTSVLFNLCKEHDIFLYYAVYHGKKPQCNEMAKLLIQKVLSLRSCSLV
jgi:Transposase family tnp2